MEQKDGIQFIKNLILAQLKSFCYLIVVRLRTFVEEFNNKSWSASSIPGELFTSLLSGLMSSTLATYFIRASQQFLLLIRNFSSNTRQQCFLSARSLKIDKRTRITLVNFEAKADWGEIFPRIMKIN